MTGGQPSATSPVNLAGEKMRFDLAASLAAYGAKVVQVGAYEKDGIRKALKTALADAAQGEYTTIVVGDGGCIQMINKSSQRVKVDPDACKKCGACLVCPGLEEGTDGVPYVTNLCSGCGGQAPACVQMCPTHVLKVVDLKDLDLPSMPAHPAPPEIAIPVIAKKRPERLSLAIRGVGGQGSLFFGHVLTQLASLAGYTEDNIIKGETHGMAQMGGPVISTFACGKALSPQPLPGSVDCLLVMEKGEVLRPGFLALLKPGGKVILAGTRIIPPGMSAEQYPSDAVIREALAGVEVFEVDILARALELGDASGRIANVVMMGLLSTLSPFDQFPPEMWQQALKNANAKPAVWAANYAAFNAGRAVKV
jgi:indolepyruvate ferredoxin oxidoreductase alpha subunit